MTWRPVVGFDDIYEVSDAGEVRRVVSVMGAAAGEVLSPWLAGAGYQMVGLRRPGSRRVRAYVHRLVAVAFLGAPPRGKPEVNHIDGNKLNNAASNLEWVSHSENHRHAYRLGLSGLARRNLAVTA